MTADYFGIEFTRPETSQAKLPNDITDLSSEQLAEMFTVLTAWADFIAAELMAAQLAERSSLKTKELAEDRMLNVKMLAAAKGDRVTYVKAQVAAEPSIVELDSEYETCYARRKALEMILSNHDRDLNLVSREITRRGSGRSDRWGT